MQSVDQIVHRQDLIVAQPIPAPAGELNEFAKQHINSIFKRLAHTFPSFKNAYRTEEERTEVKRVWVKALVESGVCSTEQIARGMAKARQHESDFFPSVGKFISWCKPDAADMGLPIAHEAWLEINRNSHQIFIHQWSHSAVYEAGRRLGWHEVRNGFVTQKQFEMIYKIIVDEVASGAEFKLPEYDASRLEHHANGEEIRTEESIKAAKLAIQEMKKGLGL